MAEAKGIDGWDSFDQIIQGLEKFQSITGPVNWRHPQITAFLSTQSC